MDLLKVVCWVGWIWLRGKVCIKKGVWYPRVGFWNGTMVSRGVKSPLFHKKKMVSHTSGLLPPKWWLLNLSPSVCLSKSHNYVDYDKAPYIVCPTSSPQRKPFCQESSYMLWSYLTHYVMFFCRSNPPLVAWVYDPLKSLAQYHHMN